MTEKQGIIGYVEYFQLGSTPHNIEMVMTIVSAIGNNKYVHGSYKFEDFDDPVTRFKTTLRRNAEMKQLAKNIFMIE